MDKIIVMASTLQYITEEANKGNLAAIEFFNDANDKNVEQHETYVVLTDKSE